MSGQPEIECWRVAGSVWLRAEHVTNAMRFRADELEQASEEAEDPEHATAYLACAEEFRRQADILDASVSLALTG